MKNEAKSAYSPPRKAYEKQTKVIDGKGRSGRFKKFKTY